MTSFNPSIFDNAEWGLILNNIKENEVVDATNGNLIGSEESFVVKLLDPKTQDELELNLHQIVEISKRIMEKTPSADKKKLEEVDEGLKHLESQLRSSIEEHELYGKDSFYDAIFFYDEREEFSNKMDNKKNQLPKIKENNRSTATEKSVSESDKENLPPFNKDRLLALVNQKITTLQINELRSLIKEDKNILFALNPENASFFDLAVNKCPIADLLPLLEDVLLDTENLQPKHVAKLKEMIFEQNLPGGVSLFESIMQGNKANIIFDACLKLFNDNDLNADVNKKLQMLDFAHSMNRYNYIFFNEKDLPPETINFVNESYKKLQLSYEESIKSKISSQNPSLYEDWLGKRRSNSSTLSTGDHTKVEESTARWKDAEKLRSEYSIRDRTLKPRFELERIKMLHIKLCRGEDGIKNPGKLRKGVVRTSGGWSHFYCPAAYLEKNVESFMSWFNAGLTACEEGRLNPIIFSAQTYQRCVSLHPFENGNGRISRILMDYVLERFNLPPPIIETDVLDAVFPMDQPQPSRHQFLEKIIKGIEKSKGLLD